VAEEQDPSELSEQIDITGEPHELFTLLQRTDEHRRGRGVGTGLGVPDLVAGHRAALERARLGPVHVVSVDRDERVRPAGIGGHHGAVDG
jgi:hypothetical protein